MSAVRIPTLRLSLESVGLEVQSVVGWSYREFPMLNPAIAKYVPLAPSAMLNREDGRARYWIDTARLDVLDAIPGNGQLSDARIPIAILNHADQYVIAARVIDTLNATVQRRA